MAKISAEKLRGEIEEVIRTMPPKETIRHQSAENLSWLGRASAAMYVWDGIRAHSFDMNVRKLSSSVPALRISGVSGIIAMLHQAQNELRLASGDPTSVAIDQGAVFEYFKEVRKVIALAKNEIFFVDPYLNAEFAIRYLPLITQGVSVRLLGRKFMKALVPAAKLWSQEFKASLEVRSAPTFHDRFIFVDRSACYQSSGSFSDGAETSSHTLTQIVDAFEVVSGLYEQKWSQGTRSG